MGGFHYFMLGIGALAMVCGLLILVMRVRTMISGRVADAVVVGSNTSTHTGQGGKVKPVHHALFEFKHEGKTYRCESSLGLGNATAEGTRVRVRYLPSDPQNSAEIDSVAAIWVFPVGATLIGAVFIAIAFYDAGYFGK